MGDRGNIVMRFGGKTDIYLYTHWSGSEIGATAQRALTKQWRWDDDAYLARIVFDELTTGQHGKETGFGIAPYPCDNEHDYLCIDVEAQKVRRLDAGNKNEKQSWSFEEFVKLTEDELDF